MRLLPGVVGGRASCLLVAVLTMAVLAGCSRFDASLSQREAVVTFQDNATLTQRMTVRAACAKVPSVTAPPLPSDLKSPYALQPLIYRIDQASDADVAKLEKCLATFSSVVGVTLQDSSDTGG
jgi:hypothetical protein